MKCCVFVWCGLHFWRCLSSVLVEWRQFLYLWWRKKSSILFYSVCNFLHMEVKCHVNCKDSKKWSTQKLRICQSAVRRCSELEQSQKDAPASEITPAFCLRDKRKSLISIWTMARVTTNNTIWLTCNSTPPGNHHPALAQMLSSTFQPLHSSLFCFYDPQLHCQSQCSQQAPFKLLRAAFWTENKPKIPPRVSKMSRCKRCLHIREPKPSCVCRT